MRLLSHSLVRRRVEDDARRARRVGDALRRKLLGQQTPELLDCRLQRRFASPRDAPAGSSRAGRRPLAAPTASSRRKATSSSSSTSARPRRSLACTTWRNCSMPLSLLLRQDSSDRGAGQPLLLLSQRPLQPTQRHRGSLRAGGSSASVIAHIGQAGDFGRLSGSASSSGQPASVRRMSCSAPARSARPACRARCAVQHG